MNVQGSNAGTPAGLSNEMFQVIQQAQQKQQELTNKMIELSVEQKVNKGKNALLGKIIDVRF
jgi:hypothetical protein